MDDLIAIRSAEVARTAGAVPDLPQGASCETCGYSLHGLTETRCPECGAEFDPARVLKDYRPLWPSLLTWYLGGTLVGQALWLTAMLSTRVGLAGWALGLLSCVLLAVALLGLWRRRDWGRRAAVLAVILPAFVRACVHVIVFAAQRKSATAAMAPITLEIIQLLLDVVFVYLGPAAILAYYLLSGLRLHTLPRGEQSEPPRLPLNRTTTLQDWPALIAALLLSKLVASLVPGARAILVLTGVTAAGRWSVGSPTAVSTAVAAFLLLLLMMRHPGHVRKYVLLMFLLLLGIAAINASSLYMQSVPLPQVVPLLSGAVAWAAITLWVYFRLDHVAIGRASRG